VQERLIIQIANELKSVLQTNDVAVVIDAVHLCVSSRGVKDNSSRTVTAEYGGAFLKTEKRDEFLRYVNSK
jgi:GTP cyclohydrolase I